MTALGSRALPEDQPIRIAYNNLAPGYFATLGIPLVAGRDFDRRDVVGTPKGAAQAIWYSPTFEIRYAGSADEVLAAARDAVAGVDRSLTIFRAKTLELQTRESLARERLLATLSTYLGGFALLLACVGLHGLMTYGVTQRTAELGLRMALGARPAGVRRLVLNCPRSGPRASTRSSPSDGRDGPPTAIRPTDTSAVAFSRPVQVTKGALRRTCNRFSIPKPSSLKL